MSSTIYNEGRVVGYSAYEIYVRHSLSEDPNRTPASELEWLSSSIAMGSSMLLKIPAESTSVSGHHALKIILPNATNLVAANTIIGSLFLGDAEFDNSGWATKVTSYGPLLDNNSLYLGTHPNTMNESPLNPQNPLSSTYQDRILNYIKLVDGIVIQPGEWKNSTDTFTPPATYPNPKHDLSPDFDYPDNGSVPYVRLYLSDRVSTDFYILLTGFTLNGVITGVSGLDGSTDTTTNMHENGGFLGPAVFPWANKIIFSVPPAYASYFLDSRYTRAIQNRRTSDSPESYGDPENIRAMSIVDVQDPDAYYESELGESYVKYELLEREPDDWADMYTHYYEHIDSEYTPVEGSSAPTWDYDLYYKKVTPCIKINVTECNNVVGDSVLTVYQRSAVLPPALYASAFSSTGEYKLNPVDVVAPGTVKMYENDTAVNSAKALENEIPGNYALMRDTSDYVVKELDDQQHVVPVAEASVVDLSDDTSLAKGVKTQTGKIITKSLSMADANGNAYSVEEQIPATSNNTIAPESGNIHWETLLKALAGNKGIDILSTERFTREVGSRLHGDGFGIAINPIHEDPGDPDSPITGYTIINNKPNVDNGVGYTTLTRNKHFKSVGYNGFTSFTRSTDPDDPYSGFDVSTANPEPPLTVSILPSATKRNYNFNGTIVKIPEYINISVTAGTSSAGFAKAPHDAPRGANNFLNPEISKRGFFIGDASSYEQVTSAPGDWSTNWDAYYYRKSSNSKPYYFLITSDPGNFRTDLFVYKRTDPNPNYIYTLTTAVPQDWNSTYTQYYTKSGNNYNPVPAASTPPSWTTSTYYERHWNWNYLPGFRLYHTDGAYSETGVYSWLFGVQFLKTKEVDGQIQDNIITLVDGSELNLNHVVSAMEAGEYRFKSTASGTSGIWNVSVDGSNSSPRASWGAYTNMYQGFRARDTYRLLTTQPQDWNEGYENYYTRPSVTLYEFIPNTNPTWAANTYYYKLTPDFYYHPEGLPAGPQDVSRNSHIFAATASYADGYNNQFHVYDKVAEQLLEPNAEFHKNAYWQDGRSLYSRRMNVSVSCVFYHL